MTPFLEAFEQELLTASRALAQETRTAPTELALREPRTRSRLRWLSLRSFSVATLAALLSTAVLACTALAVISLHLLGGGAQAKLLASFECQPSARRAAIVPAVTGRPLTDCAVQWPQDNDGHRAPALTVWGVSDDRGLVAVATPANAHSPGRDWRRLPDDWTVNLRVVELTDQFANITSPFAAVVNGGCSRIPADIGNVRETFRIDGLRGWSVRTRASSGPVAKRCFPVAAIVNGQSRSVLLVQLNTLGAASAANNGTVATSTATSGGSNGATSSTIDATSSTTALTTSTTTTASGSQPGVGYRSGPKYLAALTDNGRKSYLRLKQLYAEVNKPLASGCESVTAASTRWQLLAQRAGYGPATPAFWHEVNTHRPDPKTFFQHYTLYRQPASQQTGSCAHVLVMIVPGSGLANVYVARFAP